MFLLMTGIVYGVTLNQNQLDALDVDTFTWQTLQCQCPNDSPCTIELRGHTLYTGYECLSIYPQGSGLYLFNYTQYNTRVSLDWGWQCLEETNGDYEECESQYWGKVVKQALVNVNNIISVIESFQTIDDTEYWEDWQGTIFQ